MLDEKEIEQVSNLVSSLTNEQFHKLQEIVNQHNGKFEEIQENLSKEITDTKNLASEIVKFNNELLVTQPEKITEDETGVEDEPNAIEEFNKIKFNF